MSAACLRVHRYVVEADVAAIFFMAFFALPGEYGVNSVISWTSLSVQYVVFGLDIVACSGMIDTSTTENWENTNYTSRSKSMSPAFCHKI